MPLFAVLSDRGAATNATTARKRYAAQDSRIRANCNVILNNRGSESLKPTAGCLWVYVVGRDDVRPNKHAIANLDARINLASVLDLAIIAN